MNEKNEVRWRNPVRTRAAILAAAVEVFGRQGYSQAGLRDIAALAGRSSSLILRYFDGKADLFEAALVETLRTNSVFTWRKDDFGETMARLIRDRSNVNITVMLMQALSAPESRAIATRVWQEHMIAPLADWLGPPDAEARANSLFALMSGLTFQIHGLADGEPPEAQIQWAAKAMQSLVKGDV
ncbi:TetR/AcrR family transcriptional regulator [Novosphingobium beihaiensis]|uniref:TetR family transcriptional regulator n=1 Tax=Novosphingobium beihaiensis TaxID=2930389 RepID=A0ABT0BRK4_9SPHN|nr:TetR/AcrR family transcriptional regulator [Novosphingobium beihaiensis]MCJ2187690.1 TetR family transcriptional regulator [Novosphingobium beihaiensis]